ncbi:MAG: DUF4389 domain-containing protein [Chloroflexi bacterium]|nr:DUF4389 domain-containing protein [Chloroflexota bacterium]MCH8116156.1 DUF4389 domain-containing protein [Chloroflexota bacterium]MCI0774553.1 DUF4389 domain-containing protein [Chloroflexota bacterium]MCI0803634.1 DUF4389 domain-containing protein [Chloroflexota bacterium]MCI0807687.1 DUF4389 domain-containing protein [Chloroflexota bacterium]
MTTEAQPQSTYPARLSVDYAGANRNRLTTLFRVITVVPILIVIMALNYSAGSVLVLPVLLMILFRQKYPRWWFDFNVQYQRFSTRFGLYLGLVTDDYPSTDEEQGVHLEIDYPDAMQLNRWLPLVKWILAIPHYVALFVLTIISIIVIVIGWFVILFTGNFPRGFHDFIVGVTRWTLRVTAYAFLLTTDEYPPFSLD